MLIAGIEEAGRGPAIGPMIICIVLIEESLNPELVEWGLKTAKC
jgi:ribonuclease HII